MTDLHCPNSWPVDARSGYNNNHELEYTVAQAVQRRYKFVYTHLIVLPSTLLQVQVVPAARIPAQQRQKQQQQQQQHNTRRPQKPVEHLSM
jgi:hypothetical protein